MSTPRLCTESHDCGRYLPHHAECCPCAQGMSERWADAANRLLRVVEAATDLLWKATQYGETEDGDTAAYILPKGTVHRLIGAVQGAGFPAALRADVPPDHQCDGEESWCWTCEFRERLRDPSQTDKQTGAPSMETTAPQRTVPTTPEQP